jgi:hypothetical protein
MSTKNKLENSHRKRKKQKQALKQAIIVDVKDARFNSALLKCVSSKTHSKASNVKTCVVV